MAFLAQPLETVGARLLDDTVTIEMPASETLESRTDLAVATRRVARVASIARETLARADLAQPPRLDLLAVLADEVAWAHASGAGFCVVLVHLPGLSSTKSGATASAESKLRAALEVIAGAVRSTDIVSGRGDDFLAVLHEADDRGAELAAKRISAAVAAAPLRSSSKTRRARGFAAWSVGRARYPADGASREALLARATATLEPIDVRR
jgi:GGDEF domain-containing protein